MTAAGLSAPIQAVANCAPDVVEIRGDFGTARFSVELADDASERSHGLMNRRDLPRSSGMLFVYDAIGRPSFWMKNTLIPLDMIFVAPDGRVTKVHAMAKPLDESLIDGGPGVSAVLEIHGGLAERLGIASGAEMRHPAFGPDAAWPCE